MPASPALLRSLLLCLLLVAQGVALAGHDPLETHDEQATECITCALQAASEDLDTPAAAAPPGVLPTALQRTARAPHPAAQPVSAHRARAPPA